MGRGISPSSVGTEGNTNFRGRLGGGKGNTTVHSEVECEVQRSPLGAAWEVREGETICRGKAGVGKVVYRFQDQSGVGGCRVHVRWGKGEGGRGDTNFRGRVGRVGGRGGYRLQGHSGRWWRGGKHSPSVAEWEEEVGVIPPSGAEWELGEVGDTPFRGRV